ncbi:25769_t:CDS:2 [Gigaspora margarita]|uniref:25769_t:CDS:1 n=1 Tax=Gigaspora margarita TaxID=4874 RepID=A0ABN7W0T9_GIGMA|nr:25769_t:CDS:2 [Gigaspora margarita]
MQMQTRHPQLGVLKLYCSATTINTKDMPKHKKKQKVTHDINRTTTQQGNDSFETYTIPKKENIQQLPTEKTPTPNQNENTNAPTPTRKSQNPDLSSEKIAPMTPVQPQDLTLSETNITSQPNLEVNKQPDMEGLEEEIQRSEQDKQNS